jgi:hypothetical protein
MIQHLKAIVACHDISWRHILAMTSQSSKLFLLRLKIPTEQFAKKLLLRSTLKFLKRATFCVSQLIVSPADAVAPSEHLPLDPLVVIDLSFPNGFSARSHNSMRPSSIAAAKDVEFCGAQTTLAKVVSPNG